MRKLKGVLVLFLVCLFLLPVGVQAEQQDEFLETVLIEPGIDINIVPDDEKKSGYSEQGVENNKTYRISKYPITQSQFEEVMGYNPSFFQGKLNNPVESLSFYDAVMFCNKLSERQGLMKAYKIKDISYAKDGNFIIGADVRAREWSDGYRLPTYIEWLYASLGGIENETTLFPGSNEAKEVAWYRENSDKANSSLDDFNNGGTMPVGKKKPNGYGLYDMAGNTYEYVFQLFENGDIAVVGGGWYSERYELVAGYGVRANTLPNKTARKFVGFRPIRYVDLELDE